MRGRPVTFVFLREGSSDDGLIPHLRTLIIRFGADEAIGQARDYRGTPVHKLNLFRAEGIPADLVFVHRDADRARPDDRRSEIFDAAAACDIVAPVVPVIPVQELEAWLLTDEQALRRIVGRPHGRAGLGLPPLAAIERTVSPKERLRDALLAASEATGRRRLQERKDFEKRRRALLERLDIDGSVRQLEAWRQLETDIQSAMEQLAQE